MSEWADAVEQVTQHILARVAADVAHDAAVLETACEMSLVDPAQRGVKVDRATGSVYLSEDVPYGSIYEYLESWGRPAPGPRLFLKGDE